MRYSVLSTYPAHDTLRLSADVLQLEDLLLAGLAVNGVVQTLVEGNQTIARIL